MKDLEITDKTVKRQFQPTDPEWDSLEDLYNWFEDVNNAFDDEFNGEKEFRLLKLEFIKVKNRIERELDKPINPIDNLVDDVDDVDDVEGDDCD